MKAVLVHGPTEPANITVQDWPEPVAAPGEVLLRLEAAEINYPDLLVIRGTYQNLPPVPFIPGKTLVGRVVAGPRAGERVLAYLEHGAFAEVVAVREAHCCPVPDGMPPAQAAALGLAAQTAWFALVDRARLVAGESVLVLGASGAVGQAALAVAKALGAGRVIAAIRSDAAAAEALRHGADATIRLDAPELRAALRAANSGKLVDVVLDPLGDAVTQAALRCLDWCGRLVVIGFAAGGIPSVKLNYLLLKNITITGLQWSDYRDRVPDRVQAAQAAIFGWWREGRMLAEIGLTVPLSDAAAGLVAVAGGAGGRRVIIVADTA